LKGPVVPEAKIALDLLSKYREDLLAFKTDKKLTFAERMKLRGKAN
jgi:hypothetical protein